MKKIFGIVVLTVVSLSFLVAQEESSFGKPSFSIENELTIKLERQGEDDNKGNFKLADKEPIANETTANFAVGFAIGENFMLTPFVKDSVAVNETGTFDGNEFTLGLKGKYKPLDLLAVNFGVGYISSYGSNEMLMNSSKNQAVSNGFSFNAGLDVEVESIFLELGLSYKVKGMFAGYKTGSNSNDYLKNNKFTNTIALEAKFDFFNFIKEGLNSGLVLANETKIKSEWGTDKSKTDSKDFEGKKKIENDFGIGLHFAPIEYMDLTCLVKVASESERKHTAGAEKYTDPSKAYNVGLSLGLEFAKDMFTFGIEYNPMFSGKETSSSGDVSTTKNFEHEFKFVVGIEL